MAIELRCSAPSSAHVVRHRAHSIVKFYRRLFLQLYIVLPTAAHVNGILLFCPHDDRYSRHFVWLLYSGLNSAAARLPADGRIEVPHGFPRRFNAVFRRECERAAPEH